MKLKGIKKVHFIGVCGYIMSATAVILKKMGYQVTGSDKDAYPPGTKVVDAAGIKWFKKYSPDNLDSSDLVVVVGNHISKENLEAQAAIKRGLLVISLPELIVEIFADKKRIVVAGTHGKTTTSSLIAWILEVGGLEPSFLVGGIIQNTKTGFKLGKGDFFVVEGDEYRTAFFDKRPKLFHYQPDIAVLTNCELDHPDFFQGLEAVKKTFIQFLNLVPNKGLIVAGIDDFHVASIFKKIKKPKISFGLNEKARYQGIDIQFAKRTAKFKVRKDGQFWSEFELLLPGKINVVNALAAIAVSDYLGIDVKKIQKGIASFRGVKRRFEVIAGKRGVVIVDDYAHHPTKISKTLAAAKTRYKQNKIYCVFEPHTYSRTKTLLSDYGRAFRGADQVVVAKLMPAREAGQKPSVFSKDVVKAIKKYNKNVKLIPTSSEILAYLSSKIRRGDVVIVMSVSGLNNLARELALWQDLGFSSVRLNEQLAKYTSFKIGGPADLFLVCKSNNDFKKAVKAAKKLEVPYFILGGGSNLLVSDKGFRGLVIKNQTKKIRFTPGLVEVDSGVLMSQLIKKTIDKDLAGLEDFFGLPGTVGGAISGNAHFQGKNIKSIVSKVKKIDNIILSVVFKLKPGNKKELWQKAKEAAVYRKTTQPLNHPSAGCIFKNPDSQPAGYLIERCGLKGSEIGAAMVSRKHANFIVNAGTATCQDVLKLIGLCQKKVKDKFGIKLEEEIIKVGDFDE